MKKYQIYLVCSDLNVGRKSIVMANNITEAVETSLSMYPGYTLLSAA